MGQELLGIAGESIAEWASGIEAPKDKTSPMARVVNTIKLTAQAMPYLLLPGTAVDVAGAARKSRVPSAAEDFGTSPAPWPSSELAEARETAQAAGNPVEKGREKPRAVAVPNGLLVNDESSQATSMSAPISARSRGAQLSILREERGRILASIAFADPESISGQALSHQLDWLDSYIANLQAEQTQAIREMLVKEEAAIYEAYGPISGEPDQGMPELPAGQSQSARESGAKNPGMSGNRTPSGAVGRAFAVMQTMLQNERSEVLQRLAKAGPNTVAGQLLMERWRELNSQLAKVRSDRNDAIRRLLTEQNPGLSTSEKTSAAEIPSKTGLLFSRRESGESSDGIHRLARPQVSWYESPQDERNDPAAALHSLQRGHDATAPQQRWKPGRRLASYAGLLAWSREHGKILDPSRFANVEEGVGGGEHIVTPALDQSGRLYKLTKPGFFGAQGEDAGKYLQRWALANRVFGDEVRFEGMVTLPGETEARAVISQPEVMGRDASDAEQADYLRSKGFVEEDGRWIHPILGVSVWDTITPGNVIVRPDGTMQAVDLQIGPAKADDLEAVRKRTGIGRPTVFSKTGIRPEDEILKRASEPITITEGKESYHALNPSEALKWLRDPANGIIGEHENPDTGISWNVSGNSFSKMVKQGVKSGEPVGAHAVRIAASYHLPELIRNAKGFELEDLREDANVARLYDLFAPFRFNGTLYRLRIKGKVFHNQGNKAHSMRVDDIVAEKVPLEGNGNLASKSPRMTTATNGKLTVRELFKGVNPYSGSVFSIGKRTPGVGLSTERVPANSRQVQFWIEQATANWPTKLPIVVHDSVGAILNAGLREQVAAEGDVEGFYNGVDGSIHILADRVSSQEDVRRVVRHEGLHWVFDGPLRREYLDILNRVAKSVPEERLREISALYKNQGPGVWMEEYLVQEGQNAPNSPVWRQFVYEVKRVLRRIFGDRVEFSDEDVRAFLSKAARRLEGRRASGSDFGKVMCDPESRVGPIEEFQRGSSSLL